MAAGTVFVSIRLIRRRAGGGRRSGLVPVALRIICHIVRPTMTPSGPCVLDAIFMHGYDELSSSSTTTFKLRRYIPQLDPIPFLGVHRPRTAHPCILHSRRSWSEHCAQMHSRILRSWRGMPTGNEPPTS